MRQAYSDLPKEEKKRHHKIMTRDTLLVSLPRWTLKIRHRHFEFNWQVLQ